MPHPTVPAFLLDAIGKLTRVRGRRAALQTVTHYLLYADAGEVAACAPLVLPPLPAALAALPGVAEPEWVGKPLARLGRAGLPLVVDLTRSRDVRLREAAAWAFAGLGVAAADAATALHPLLADDSRAVRRAAIAALAAARPDAESVALLVGLFGDGDDEVACEAIRAVGELVVALATATGASQAQLSANGVVAVAAAALPALLDRIGPEARPTVRYHSFRTLEVVGVPAAERRRLRPALASGLGEWGVESLNLGSALAIVHRMGAAARDMVPDLEPILFAEGLFSTRVAEAAGALLRLDPAHADAERALRRLADSADDDERSYAATELAQADALVRERLAEVIARLEADEDEGVRDAIRDWAGDAGAD